MSDKVNILIVEDEALFASKMEMQIEKLGHHCVGIVDNSDAALPLIEDHAISLILMDINIAGDYDGIELAEMIQSKRDIPILFVTSNYDDLSFKRATRNSPAGFIVKPFTDIQLQRAIELALLKSAKKTENNDAPLSEIKDGCIFIRKLNNIIKVLIDDIYYLEADGRYVQVYTKSEKFLVRQSLKALTARLSSTSFLQCHRSYVVNIKKVKSVNTEDNLVNLEERSLPLSRREKENLLARLNYI